MSEQTDNHDYATPPSGTENWHEPLNANFEALDVDVEVRDVAENREDYEPDEGAKFLELDTGVVYVGDGEEWTPALAMAYYDEGGELTCGELADCLEPESEPDDDNNSTEVTPSTFGVNARSVHQGAIVFGDSTRRGIWSESADELRSQMPTYAPKFATDGVAVEGNDVDATGRISAGAVSTSTIDAGGLSADDDELAVELEGDEPELKIEPNTVTVTVDDGEATLVIDADGVTSDEPFYAPEFNTTSARAAKTAIQPVDPQGVLEDVESLSVRTWEFDDREGGRHMGPMAGDFAERFELGDGEDSIATVDADGVALAAIQGLAERLREENERLSNTLATVVDRLDELEAENDALEKRLARIDGDVGSRSTSAPDRAQSDD